MTSKDLAIPPKTARAARVFAARLQRLPGALGKHPGLLFSPGLEGYRDYTFGFRSGPSVQARHVFHELGHAAQFGPDSFESRASPYGFVFNMRQVFVMGRPYDEPITSQATDRELETFAHELHLLQAAGYQFQLADFLSYSASVMRHMPDWIAIPGERGADRKRECERRLLAFYESLTQAEVLDKLTGWLDATRAYLAGAPERPYNEVALRFRTDGTLYQG